MRTILSLLLLSIFLSCGQTAEPQETETTILETPVDMAATPDSLLRHVVMFSFLEESYPDGVTAVEDAFRELSAKIPEIHSFEWGINNSPEGLDKGFTHVFFVTFKSEADRAVYLPHPDHLAFVDVLKPHLDQVMVLDYWAKQ